MSLPDTKKTDTMDLEHAVALLTHVLNDQLSLHDRLLDLISAKREAVRAAHIDAIPPICEQERRTFDDIRRLETRRNDVVRTIAERIGLPMRECTTSRIQTFVSERAGTRLNEHAEALRLRIERVQRESSIVREAATALAQHMGGLMRTIQSALSQAGVYGRRGVVEDGLQMQFNVDIKS